MIRTFQKFGVGLIAMVMAVVFSAFTTPKASPAATSSFTGELYWYAVDEEDQIIKQGTGYVYGLKAQVPTDCEDDHPTLDCFRGFESPINTSMGDVTATGDQQIKRSLNP